MYLLLPQVSLMVDGGKKGVEFKTLEDRHEFRSRDLLRLFDRQWHRLGVSVRVGGVALYLDCALVERRTVVGREKGDVSRTGHTRITGRAEDGQAVDVSPGNGGGGCFYWLMGFFLFRLSFRRFGSTVTRLRQRKLSAVIHLDSK